MNRYNALSAQLGMFLMLLNLVAWGVWFAAREPYTPAACAVLQATRSERDEALSSSASFTQAYIASVHLLFARPLHPLSSEPTPVKILYVSNALPLVGAWSFLVPSQSNELGPTCSESRTCGILFLILSTAQWGLLGGAAGYFLRSRRI
jgi:hypothetical protein